MSARHAAREAALLMLFSLDMAKSNDAEDALEIFREAFADDADVMAQLLGGDAEAQPDDVLKRARSVMGQDARAWQFTERLVRGVVGHSTVIDELIGRCSLNWKISRMGRVDRNVLRLATYELAFEGDVPPRVTLNEAIELAKRFGTEESGSFVNGILDRVAQELEARDR